MLQSYTKFIFILLIKQVSKLIKKFCWQLEYWFLHIEKGVHTNNITLIYFLIV